MPSYFESSIPVVIHKLNSLKHIVQLGEKHAAENSIDESVLMNFRLYPDMLPFRSQINIPTDISCGMVHRLTGAERHALNDDLNSFAELIARIDETIEHLKAQDPADYEGAESKDITIKTPFSELNFKGDEYLTHFIFPNLYFHITTAYNILRHNGVKLGKQDFLGGGN